MCPLQKPLSFQAKNAVLPDISNSTVQEYYIISIWGFGFFLPIKNKNMKALHKYLHCMQLCI